MIALESEHQIIGRKQYRRIDNPQTYWDVWRTYSLPMSPYARLAIWLLMGVGSAVFNTCQAPEWRLFTWCWCLLGSIIGDFILTATTKKLSRSAQINQLEISENGVIANFADGGKILINWLKVASIKIWGADLVIKTSSMPQLNIVIPQRAVGTKEDLEVLRVELDTLWSDWLLNGSKYRLQTESIKQIGLTVEANNTFSEVLVYTLLGGPGKLIIFLVVFNLLIQSYFAFAVNLVFLLMLPAIAWRSAKHPDINQPGTTSISPNGVQTLDGVNGNFKVYSWDFFKRIYIRSNMLVLAGNGSNLLIPLRCFESPNHAAFFISEAKKFHAASALNIMNEIKLGSSPENSIGMSNFCSEIELLKMDDKTDKTDKQIK